MRARAARLQRHGEPLEVEEVDLPDPGPGEVVVELAYGGVNPLDRYGALGRVAAERPLPRTLGTEAAGHLDGRPVVVRGHGLGSERDGLWATAAVVPARAAVEVPEGVDLEQAAAVGVAGVTAWRCVREYAGVRPQDRVLVLGASGGVGSIAVSVARSAGATVWGQTGDEKKAAWIRERGAHEVVVTDADGLAAACSELGPTVVLDPLGDGFFGAAVRLLEPRGRLVLFGTSADPTGEVPLQELYRKGLTVYGYAGLLESDEVLAEGMRRALKAIAEGDMEVVVDRTVPLGEVNRAFELLSSRSVTGKVVLDLTA